jgi:hypothetical protein
MISLYNTNENGNGNNGNGHNGSGRKWRPFWMRRKSEKADLTAVRRIALQLHFDLSSGDQSRSALIATPRGPRRCAETAAALASCMGDFVRKPILLVDACPPGGNLSELTHCVADCGFADAILHPDRPLEEFVVPTGNECVSFLPAGPASFRTDRVPPEQFENFLDRARARYEFVLLAGSDVLHDSLSLVMAPSVGCVMLVLFENETKVDDLDAAQAALRICGTRKMGLVWSEAGGSR